MSIRGTVYRIAKRQLAPIPVQRVKYTVPGTTPEITLRFS